jgi:hypothetical protein
MIIKETLVTPDMAYKWLEGNTHNRTLRHSVVETYARDMAVHEWRLTPECIAFDVNKVLVDGQHRLWSVIESKTPTRFMVAYDVDPNVRAVIGSPVKRTDVDHLQFGYDLKVTPMHTAVAKRLHLALHPEQRGRSTTAELRTILETHGPAIDFSINAFTRVVRGITTAPVMTVIARAFYRVDTDKLRHFVDTLCTGRITDASEDPILMLRNFLLERAAPTGVQYAKAERALLAYTHGERMSTLYAAAHELFPLPEETTTRVRRHKGGADTKTTVEVSARKLPKRRPSSKGQEVKGGR